MQFVYFSCMRYFWIFLYSVVLQYCIEILALWQHSVFFLPNICCACTEVPISKLLALILAMLLDSATLSSCNSRIFQRLQCICTHIGAFSLYMHRNCIISTSVQIYCHHCSQLHRFPVKVLTFLRCNNTIVDFWLYFYWAHAETAISKRVTKILIISLDSATPIYCKSEIS